MTSKKRKTTEIWKSLGITEKYHAKLKKLAQKNHRTIFGQVAIMIDAEERNLKVPTKSIKGKLV